MIVCEQLLMSVFEAYLRGIGGGNLKSTEKLVAMGIAGRCDPKSHVIAVTNDFLATDLSFSKRTITTATNGLRDKGIIQKARRKFRALDGQNSVNVYWFPDSGHGSLVPAGYTIMEYRRFKIAGDRVVRKPQPTADTATDYESGYELTGLLTQAAKEKWDSAMTEPDLREYLFFLGESFGSGQELDGIIDQIVAKTRREG